MDYIDFEFKAKADDSGEGERGSFTGLASTYDLDQGGDKVMPGAFTKTLQSSKGVFPLLWQHQSDSPIGSVTCVETAKGLSVTGNILLSDPTGKRAYDLIRAGVLKGMSIGYSTVKESYEGAVRLLNEVRLFEVSIVTFPMQQSALIASVKNMAAMSDAQKAKHIKSVDEHRKAIDRHQRGMREDLKSLFGSDLFPDDDGASAEVDVDELNDVDSKAVLVELQKMLVLTGGQQDRSTTAVHSDTQPPRSQKWPF